MEAVSLLSRVTTKKALSKKGVRFVIYGKEGSGKTTLATSARNAILVQAEDGDMAIRNDDVAILPKINTYEELEQILRELARATLDHKDGLLYETIILDSMTAIERLIHDYVIRLDPEHLKRKLNMETAHGGYGKAYLQATDVFNKLLATLDWFTTKGINIIATCHAMAIDEKDTIAESQYTMMDCALHSPKNGKTTGKRESLKQWCDVLGYLHTPVLVVGSKDDMRTAISSGQNNLLGCGDNPKYAGKNRYHATGESAVIAIPLDDGFDHLLKQLESCKSGKSLTNQPVASVEPSLQDTIAALEADTVFA